MFAKLLVFIALIVALLAVVSDAWYYGAYYGGLWSYP